MDTTTIDLKAFCEPEAPHLAEPFWREGHMYATNGKICVRVPAESGELGHAKAPSAHNLKWWWDDDNAFEWEPLPAATEKKVRCRYCDGDGRNPDVTCKCPKCGNDYFPCEDCDGKGYWKEWETVHIGGFSFGGQLVHLLSSLPNPIVFASEQPCENKGNVAGVLRVKFDGGQAILMGLEFRREGVTP